MRAERLTKYIWIIDTLTAHGALTRSQLAQMWEASSVYDGVPLAQRTFFTYRRDIEDLFGIDIECDAGYRYSITSPLHHDGQAFRSWMLDTYAMGDALSDTQSLQHRVVVDHIPSARAWLAPLLRAMKHGQRVRVSYKSYTSVKPGEPFSFEPYFLRLFKQRWYMIGKKQGENSLRTYALDRIRDLLLEPETFVLPPQPGPTEYFDNLYGITGSAESPQTVKLRIGPHYANYLRALPLHHTQSEMRTDAYSIFSYTLRITPDLVREILGMGPDATVLQPATLRKKVMEALEETLKNYNDGNE